jgi:hypothetical protein
METESIASPTVPHAPALPLAAAPHAPDSAPPEALESEQDRPKNRMIGALVLGTLALLAAIVVGVSEVFRAVFTHEVSTKQLEPPGSELRELRAEEQAKLSRYQWVSRQDGVVRIPLDRARELTLAAYHRRAATPAPGADDPTPSQGTR